VALEPNWYNTDNGALVGYTADNKPVALLPISSRAYRMVDGTGKATLVTKEIAETLQPEGYVFYRALPNQKLKLSSLLRFGLRNAGQELATIGFFGLLVSLLGLATPILTALIFDNIIPARQAGLLWQIYLALVVVAISGAIFTLLRSIATLRLETRLENALQAALWDRLLKLPINFFRNYAVGDLAERVGGIETIRQLLTGTVITSLLSGLFSLTSLFLLFSYDGTLALVALLLTVINLLVILVFGWQQLRRERELATQHGYMSSLALQLLNGIAKLRVAGGESRAFARWAAGFGKQRQITLATRQAANRLQVFNGVWTILVTLALFATIGFMSSGKNLSTGSFLAFLVAFGQFQAALLGLSEVFTEILKILPLYDRSRPILESLPEVANDKRDPGELKGDIEVNQVSFRYSPNLPPVLKDISLRIKPGQFVAVVGASGSGKSSLLRLLLGFEQPESGSIYYDKQDLATLDVQAVRQQIGAVIQNGKLLPGTIFENIAGAAPYTMQEAWEAARLAGFAQDIESMPMGMHTVISESGSTLSGGQRQRLMIARALIGQPRLILFDEATSALDNQTQAIVSQSLEKMQVTRVVIAHRLSTIQKADCIYLLKDGRIAESGTYAELMENGKFFYELASRQIV
jgi:NHLM bacteriocin system ABC transporter ATP-binding protein